MKYRIMAVDDDKLVRDFLFKALTQVGGFSVELVGTGEEALERLQGGKPGPNVLDEHPHPLALAGDPLLEASREFFHRFRLACLHTDFYMLGWTPATYDAHNALYSLLGTRAGGRGEVNVSGYSNPVLDDLIEKIGVENDQGKRQAMIDQAVTLLQKELPVIPLHQQVIIWAAKNNIDLAQLADNFFPYRYVHVK